MDEGYVSDHQCGPFVQDDVEDDEFHNMDKITPDAQIEAIPVLEEEGMGTWL